MKITIKILKMDLQILMMVGYFYIKPEYLIHMKEIKKNGDELKQDLLELKEVGTEL